MPRGKAKQLSILDETNDPQIAKIADRVVETQKEYKKQKDLFDVQSKNLMGMMERLGKKKIKHGGVMFEITETESKKKLKVKEEKGSKKSKVKSEK